MALSFYCTSEIDRVNKHKWKIIHVHNFSSIADCVMWSIMRYNLILPYSQLRAKSKRCWRKYTAFFHKKSHYSFIAQYFFQQKNYFKWFCFAQYPKLFAIKMNVHMITHLCKYNLILKKLNQWHKYVFVNRIHSHQHIFWILSFHFYSSKCHLNEHLIDFFYADTWAAAQLLSTPFGTL